MNVDFSSHKGTAELDQRIEQAIKDDDPAQIFDLIELFAELPDRLYERCKVRLKDVFKRRINISGLDRSVKEERKSIKRAKAIAKQTLTPVNANIRPRPIVELGRQLRDVVQDALKSLELWNKESPSIFVQSGRLVTITFSEKKGPSIAPLGVSSLRHKMTLAADYMLLRDTTEDVIAIPVDPPLDVVRIILEGITDASDYPFPALAGITELPIIRPDGSIYQEPGYDPVTEQVYLPGDLIIPSIPDAPTKMDVRKSIELLDYLLHDFPFTDQSSKATIIADIITVVIRSLIDGQVPLTLLDAPKQGTGKTLLALIVGIVATGRILSTNAPTDDNEEWRKRILTWLLSSPAVVVIDNVVHQLESSSLNAALTSGYVEDRLLSTNTSIRVANRAVWFATGNNLRVGDDTARRCVKCRLDAKSEQPHKRDTKQFKIGNILKWTIEHRSEIIAAVLTLMRNWYVQGRPEPTCTPLGSFEEWRFIVGGILQAANIPDFLKNLDDEDGNSSIDEVSEAWKAFITTIYDVYQSNPFTFSELAKRMLVEDEYSEILCETLPTSLTKSFDSYQRSQGRDRDFANHLGHSFRVKKGQVFSGLRLEIAGKDRTGKAKWQIVINDDSTPDKPPIPASLQSEEEPDRYDQACELLLELEQGGASIEYHPDGKRTLHAPHSSSQQKAAWRKRIVEFDAELRDIHADLRPSNKFDNSIQEQSPSAMDAFAEAFKTPDRPVVYAICPICAKVRDIWSSDKNTFVCGIDHSAPPEPEPPNRPQKKSKEAIYVDLKKGEGITLSGTPFNFPANCSLRELLQSLPVSQARVFVCGKLPEYYEEWLLNPVMWEEYTTDTAKGQGHYLDPRKPTGHVARYQHRSTGHTLEIRTMDAWLGETEYTIEQARDAVLLLTQYLQHVFTDDTIMYSTPSQTFQQIWTRQNRLEKKSYDLLPQEIRDIIHATSGQGRVELCTQDAITKLSELHYYDGVFMYAALAREMPTELETHDQVNEYAGFKPARYRISYTVPSDWQHIGLFMTPREGDNWMYPGDACQAQTFETWVDGSELDALKTIYESVEAGMQAWNITILERIVFKLQKESAIKKPLDSVIDRLKKMREQVEKDARLDAARQIVYKLVRGMVRNIVLHGIGAFHRNKRPITVILRSDDIAPDNVIDVRPLDDGRIIYTVPGKIDTYSEQFDHPEYSALVWARCRARMTKWALSLPRESIIAIRTDAIATTKEVAEWRSSDKVGTLREKWHVKKQLKAPHSLPELDALVEKHIKEER